eukprot:TRINITY_DN6759_c0_g4_i2.p9 TRINITY_DN6759_c0_g4~~TRINITY_DN6759_c0_g4_i2.p9  ORF type:complete len:112 (-),score=3.56 TRINITY_DN6759_c0_g4_i2:4-339(-)
MNVSITNGCSIVQVGELQVVVKQWDQLYLVGYVQYERYGRIDRKKKFFKLRLWWGIWLKHLRGNVCLISCWSFSIWRVDGVVSVYVRLDHTHFFRSRAYHDDGTGTCSEAE